MRKTGFTDKQINDIISEYNDKETMQAIAQRYAIHITKIKQILIDGGARLRTASERQHKILDLDIDFIIGLYNDGNSLRDIVKLVGSTQETISKLLKARGTCIKPRGEQLSIFAKNKRKNRFQNDVADIIRLFKEGYSINYLSQMHKASPCAIKKLLFDNDISARSSKDAAITYVEKFSKLLSNYHYRHGTGHISLANDGKTLCLSDGERTITNWLLDNNVDFIKDYKIGYCFIDWKVRKCFIEFFGFSKGNNKMSKQYWQRADKKMKFLRSYINNNKHKYKVIFLQKKDLKNLDKTLLCLIEH
ncbi:MAG: hypothetical protein KJ847_05110 [Firmicutes bacterium]|nr:hypothetical protein [Bacillota bacterium]